MEMGDVELLWRPVLDILQNSYVNRVIDQKDAIDLRKTKFHTQLHSHALTDRNYTEET